jgi:hypothetical protein
LAVLLLAFLDGSGDSNHDVSGPISHFCCFLIFYRFDDSNYQIDWQGLVPICTVDQYFCSLLTFCNPGECSTDIARLCLSDNWQG